MYNNSHANMVLNCDVNPDVGLVSLLARTDNALN